MLENEKVEIPKFKRNESFLFCVEIPELTDFMKYWVQFPIWKD